MIEWYRRTRWWLLGLGVLVILLSSGEWHDPVWLIGTGLCCQDLLWGWWYRDCAA